MVKLFLRRRFGLVLLAVCVAILVTGCGKTTANSGSAKQADVNVSDFYSKVQIGQTKDEVDALLAVEPSTPMDKVYQYLDDNGNGVTLGIMAWPYKEGNPVIVFSKRMIGTEKMLAAIPDDERISDEQAEKITQGMTYDEVKSILGQDGIEVSMTDHGDGSIETERYWIKKGTISILGVVFAGPNGTDVSTLVTNI